MNKNRMVQSAIFIIQTIKNPLIFLFSIYLLKYIWVFSANHYPLPFKLPPAFFFYLTGVAEIITIYWFCVNLLRRCMKKLTYWAEESHSLLAFLLPPLSSSLEAILFLMMANMLAASFKPAGIMGMFIEKGLRILLIIAIAFIFYRILVSLEQYILNRYLANMENFSASRKIQTQMIILKRVFGFLLTFFTISAIIMMFDNLRTLGASLLTTAGLISAVGAFASQQSLSRIFAGLQLFFTQPLRIGDTIVIEKELGQVEEMTLSFVTVKLWDLRRLILPTDYFIQKGLLNLTKDSTDLLGTVYLYTDYTLPVHELREKFLAFIADSLLWNKKIAKLEVTDLKENTMEIRCLMSANSASELWDLQCSMREKLIIHIVENYYDNLSKSRVLQFSSLPLEK